MKTEKRNGNHKMYMYQYMRKITKIIFNFNRSIVAVMTQIPPPPPMVGGGGGGGAAVVVIRVLL